jgi:hypothetical protein
MGVLQNPLGINLTKHQPLIDCPFNASYDQGESFPPPGSEFMITEDGIFMITETSLDLMITE